MRILHITTSLSGGAALAALRLHKALLDCGVDSRVLTLDADSPDESIVRFKPLIDFQNDSLPARIDRGILYRMNIGIGRYRRLHDKARKGHECVYSYPVSPFKNNQLLGHFISIYRQNSVMNIIYSLSQKADIEKKNVIKHINVYHQ